MSQEATGSQRFLIGPFKIEDQKAVKKLVIAGLAEHFGRVDPTLNPDLNDISTSYADATFLVTWLDGRIIGTGALIPKSDQVAEIVRMSVASDMQRQGIGTRILERLCQEAIDLGFQQIILETTSTWYEVIEFYSRFGFRISHRQEGNSGGEVHFVLDLTSAD